jgi:hypothetical protein
MGMMNEIVQIGFVQNHLFDVIKLVNVSNHFGVVMVNGIVQMVKMN